MYWEPDDDVDNFNNPWGWDDEEPCDCRRNKAKDKSIKEFDLKDKFENDMMKMLSDGSFNDMCIKLHDGEIKANKSVLAARCEYFAATFRWKINNNQDVEEIVVNDCSKKIMTRIIEYIFSGVLKFEQLSLLEFLELKDQVRKMFPGDKLEEEIENNLFRACNEFSVPSNEEILQAMSSVESGNLQSQVIAELGKAIDQRGYSFIEVKERTSALASLAHYGLLGSAKKLALHGNGFDRTGQLLPIDLGFVPSDHLQALLPRVTEEVIITNVINYDMTSLLDSVSCKELRLIQKLNQEETEALLRAMTSRVEIVHLGGPGVTSLDVDTLTKYTGDGKCRELHCFVSRITFVDGDADARDQWITYSRAVTWAEKMNWNVESRFSNEHISITRK